MIRKALEKDIPRLMDIYNEAIENTLATFDTETKDYNNRLQWFKDHKKNPYVIFVKEVEGNIAGYASLSKYRDRKAFDTTVEISIYIAPEYRSQGIGKELMEKTLDFSKKKQEIHRVISLITAINTKSISLHTMYGFEFCGTMNEVGYKKGQWLDLNIYQLKL